MARLLVGVSGGIAAYKGLETTRLAVRAGHRVRVIQTPASMRFVGSASFAAITGAPVLVDEFETDPMRGAYPGEPTPERVPISHLALVERADLFLIAPASANTIAKLALGLADNLLTTAALAATCPIVVAPAMNNRMYEHLATQANLARLADRGVLVIAPGEGDLASEGEHGIGRLPEPAVLLAACESRLASGRTDAGGVAGPGPWLGRRVLVSAGGTREPIDSVRYVGNRSSGRMGLALAAEAVRRGAKVTIVAANVALAPPRGAKVVSVQTAAELAAACQAEFADADVLLMAAAVADFRPRDPASTKLKKSDPRTAHCIDIEPTEDVLSALAAQRRPDQVLVGFAAEHGDGARAYGQSKLERKGLDAIVINDISRPGIGFDARDNEVTILASDGRERHVTRAGKEQVAGLVLDEVEPLLVSPGPQLEKERDDRGIRADAARATGV